MKKVFLTLAVFVMAICANAQKNQYFWYQGNLMMGNPIAQIDSVTFGNEDTDSIILYLPRTIVKKEIVHDTLYITIHDTICPSDVPEGALSGVFSVSPTKKVRFSKGNLQATTTDLGVNWTWAFATNQWDCIGNKAANISINGNGIVSANGTVDLFGWSTGTTKYGIHNSTDSSTDYSPYYGSFRDWGTTIGDGWYTLDFAEWGHILYGRTDAQKLLGMGKVNGVNGIILLPDDWGGDKFTDTENGLTYQSAYYYNNNGTNFSFHNYTIEQWSTMEAQGAVFLPAAGWRAGIGVYYVGSLGCYWSSTSASRGQAYSVDFSSHYIDPKTIIERRQANAVRLVCVVEN